MVRDLTKHVVLKREMIQRVVQQDHVEGADDIAHFFLVDDKIPGESDVGRNERIRTREIVVAESMKDLKQCPETQPISRMLFCRSAEPETKSTRARFYLSR
jgi:hypothetical protein